jgi:hypothetical protein
LVPKKWSVPVPSAREGQRRGKEATEEPPFGKIHRKNGDALIALERGNKSFMKCSVPAQVFIDECDA